MPVIKQKMIYREDLQANPDALYLFGDNADRAGYGGQAREMRDEENALGVRTKWTTEMTRKAFFSDDDAEECMQMIDEDLDPAIDHLKAGGIVVIPTDGLGTGLSKLPEKAPQVYAFLVERLEQLELVLAQ